MMLLRVVVALLLSLPIYFALGLESIVAFVSLIALQVLAGLDVRLGK